MRFTKLTVSLLIVSVLAISMAAALNVDVRPENSTSNHIFFDETARYNLTIENTDDVARVYTWSVNPVEWIVDSITSARVGANETEEFSLLVRPKPSNYRGPGFYNVPLRISSSDGETEITEIITVYVKSIDERVFSYKPSVALGASLTQEVDPRKPVSVQVSVRNGNIRELEELTLLIDGEHFEGSDTFALTALEQRTLEYRYEVDPQLSPGTYEMEAKLTFEGETLSRVKRFYDVVPYAVVDRETSRDSSFMRQTRVISLINNGNVQKDVSTSLDIEWWKRIFVNIDIEADNYESDSATSYNLQLEPGTTARIIVVENYIVLFVLLVGAGVALVGYFLLRSPITLEKQIIVTGKDEEGISEMKVRVFIRNRTDKSFFNLRILDTAPSIADVKASTGLGVLEPSKVVKTERKGTLVKWDFDSLEAYEERIVTYTIKARLKIIGNLTLPSVRLKYETVKGVEKTTESHKATIGTKA